MSTTTNMHAITKIRVIEFPDHYPPFISVKFDDNHGNQVILIVDDIDEFARDIRMAVAEARTVRKENT